jgi:hypothetical protein
MTRMIELHPKALQTRKRFQGARFHIRMTDSADGTLGTGKLLRMTPRAGQMARSAGTFRNRRIGVAAMAKKTGQARMVLTAVLKLSIVEPGGKLHLILGQFIWIDDRSRRTRIDNRSTEDNQTNTENN